MRNAQRSSSGIHDWAGEWAGARLTPGNGRANPDSQRKGFRPPSRRTNKDKDNLRRKYKIHQSIDETLSIPESFLFMLRARRPRYEYISFTLRRRSQSGSAFGGMADAARDAALGEDRKVFVGGIPFGVDQNVVREDFMQFGDIEDVYLPIDRDNGKLRGFAFVTYRYSKDAHAACGAMHGRDYHGRQITVNIAKPRGPREDGKGSGPPAGSNSSQYSYSRPRDYDRGFDERRHDGDSRQSGSNVRDRDRDERDERDGDRFAPRYSHGNSYDGSGRYGDRDPRPARQYYD